MSRGRQPSTPLASFLRERWRDSRLPQKAFAREVIGICKETLWALLNGGRAKRSTLAKLRAAFPDAEVMRPPRFHGDIERLLAERGWSAHAASLEAGLPANCLRRGRMPTAADAIRIAEVLGAPDVMRVAWVAEAAAVVRPTPAPRPRAAAVERRMCLGCGDTFAVGKGRAKTHSPHCTGVYRSAYLPDTPLKREFLKTRDRRGLSTGAASAAAGLPRGTVTAWLHRERGWLRDRNLAKVAAWLGITEFDDARRLQEGTVGERIVATHAADVARRKHRNWYSRVLAKASAAARAGKPRSAEHRQNIGEAVRAYHANPDRSYPPGAHNSTLRGRAQAVLRALRRCHPELTHDEVMEAAVRRLLEPPYSVGSELSARAFLTRKKDLVRTTGRPALHERYGIIQHVKATWPKHPNGLPQRGLWREIARRVLEEEGQPVPQDAKTLDEWGAPSGTSRSNSSAGARGPAEDAAEVG